MNKRPGHVEVTTEVAYCSFCDRVRNLRREEHHLGTLVRTIITCESCHRTLSSTMGVVAADAPEVEVEAPAAETALPSTPATTDEGPAPKPPVKRAGIAKPRPAAAKSKQARPKATTK